jgi:hypothetical protein
VFFPAFLIQMFRSALRPPGELSSQRGIAPQHPRPELLRQESDTGKADDGKVEEKNRKKRKNGKNVNNIKNRLKRWMGAEKRGSVHAHYDKLV